VIYEIRGFIPFLYRMEQDIIILPLPKKILKTGLNDGLASRKWPTLLVLKKGDGCY
jgi:hypothetical protein